VVDGDGVGGGAVVDMLIVSRDNFTDPTSSPASDSTTAFESVK
jgi:hypothetical protein